MRVKRKALVVGIFRDQPPEEVNSLIAKIGLDLVQLHGVEDESYMRQIKAPIIKSFTLLADSEPKAVSLKLNSSRAKYLLVDRSVQGEGDGVDSDSLLRLIPHLQKELFLAGGLTSENVVAKVKRFKPFAVDVAGGIETNGSEDIIKIKQFIQLKGQL